MAICNWGDPRCPRFCRACKIDCKCERCNVCHACFGHYTGHTSAPACGDYRHYCNIATTPAPAEPESETDSSPESSPEPSKKATCNKSSKASSSIPKLRNFQAAVQLYPPQGAGNVSGSNDRIKGIELETEPSLKNENEKWLESEVAELRSRLTLLETTSKPKQKDADDDDFNAYLRGFRDALPTVNRLSGAVPSLHKTDTSAKCYRKEIGSKIISINLADKIFDIHIGVLEHSEYFMKEAEKTQSIDISSFKCTSETFQKFVDYCYQKKYGEPEGDPENLALHASVYVLAKQIKSNALAGLALLKATQLCDSLSAEGAHKLNRALASAIPIVYSKTHISFSNGAPTLGDVELAPFQLLLTEAAAEKESIIKPLPGYANTTSLPKFGRGLASPQKSFNGGISGKKEVQAGGLALHRETQILERVWAPAPRERPSTWTSDTHLTTPRRKRWVSGARRFGPADEDGWGTG